MEKEKNSERLKKKRNINDNETWKEYKALKNYCKNFINKNKGEHTKRRYKFGYCSKGRGVPGLLKLFGALFIEEGNCLIFFLHIYRGVLQGYCV